MNPDLSTLLEPDLGSAEISSKLSSIQEEKQRERAREREREREGLIFLIGIPYTPALRHDFFFSRDSSIRPTRTDERADKRRTNRKGSTSS